MSPRRRKIDWEKFGSDIVSRVIEGLDYWCWNVSGDPVVDCYESHMDLSLYDLASEFSNWSITGIGDKDLELLSKMPDDIYDKFDNEIKEYIESVVKELAKYREEEEEESYLE